MSDVTQILERVEKGEGNVAEGCRDSNHVMTESFWREPELVDDDLDLLAVLWC
jgi:hypothetical protein